ncbi:MAG: hypothetical protein ACXABI_12515 [Candidatus Hodarchaeales archaeon]|jgi:hypothetical protein
MQEVKEITLMVNGKRIGLKKFVKEFIGNSVLGMVSSLRIKNEEITKIDLRLEYSVIND